jgi:hypothetical protein
MAEVKNWQSYCPRGSRLSNCYLQGADCTTIKIGGGDTGNESKT